MSFIDQIEEAYDARPLERMRIVEWETPGSIEAWVYWKPSTQHELDVVSKVVPEGATGSRWNVQLVVLKSLDMDGRRLFTNADADRLGAKGYSSVINRIASAMVRVPTVEEAEKK